MGELTTAIVILFLGLLWVCSVVNRIPKTGRDGTAAGDKIIATITNTNKYADAAVTLRAEKDGRKFKVKLKPTEAHLWIKGDSIEIITSEDSKKYRVLFNDYFRENEPRIREAALEKFKGADKYLIAASILKYKKEDFSKIAESSLDSQGIFALCTYMKMIDLYSVVAALLVVLTLWWKNFSEQGAMGLILPALLILFVVWSVYSAITTCKKILKKIEL